MGAIVADNQNTAKIAAGKVDIKYEVLSPIITIEVGYTQTYSSTK